MWTRFVFLLLPLFAHAELIQVPEKCLVAEVTPCLVRAANQESRQTKDKEYSYLIDNDSITKWTAFRGQPNFEVIEGNLHIKKSNQSSSVFTVNGIKVTAKSFFVARKGQKLQILDGEKFLMSEYNLSSSAEAGSVLTKVDFVDKKYLIIFLANFFHSKEQLVKYLKRSESSWRKEFALQNATQTKVLVRAVASVEEDRRQELFRKQQDENELKKVRETFFYRTFYR